MAAHAQPLWQALPDGVLKRQLLGELAELAELDTRDLADLWARSAAQASGRGTAGVPAPSSGAPATGSTRPGARSVPAGRRYASPMPGWAAPAPAPTRQRHAPVSRADQAARLLLAHMPFLEELSHDDHDALCAQPAPHGPLFAWLEEQLHEHGPQPWAALREGLRSHPCEALALRLMDSPHAQPEGDWAEIRRELRGVLNRIHIERIKAQETQAIAAMAHDPEAAQQLRALQARRLQLETHVHSASGG